MAQRELMAEQLAAENLIREQVQNEQNARKDRQQDEMIGQLHQAMTGFASAQANMMGRLCQVATPEETRHPAVMPPQGAIDPNERRSLSVAIAKGAGQ